MALSGIQALFIVMAIMAIGGYIGKITKSIIPGIFVIAISFLFGFWTFFPKNIVELASFSGAFGGVAVALLLVHLGTIMNLRELLDQWKAVLVSLVGVGGTILMALTIGQALFGIQTIVAITPPLTGGVIATLMITEALKAKGLMTLIALPITMFVVHSFLGFPLISMVLKKESKNLLKDFRVNGAKAKKIGSIVHASEAVPVTRAEAPVRKKLIPAVPKEYQSTELILAKVAIVAILGAFISKLMHGAVSALVIDLVLGVIFCEIGFLEEKALEKAGVINWLMPGLLLTAFANLGAMSMAQILGAIVPITVIALLGLTGMAITSMIMGRAVGYSKYMAFACALTSLCGFPADYIITHEVAKNNSATEEERQYLVDQMLPKMLVGGFATVSIASVVIAGIFVNLI